MSVFNSKATRTYSYALAVYLELAETSTDRRCLKNILIKDYSYPNQHSIEKERKFNRITFA